MRAFDENTFSTYDISHNLRNVFNQVEKADDEIKTEVIWKITDGILFQLSEYGMHDEPLEDAAIEFLEVLTDILIANPKLDKRRIEIHKSLEEYYESGNCGIIDDIGEAVYMLSEDNLNDSK